MKKTFKTFAAFGFAIFAGCASVRRPCVRPDGFVDLAEAALDEEKYEREEDLPSLEALLFNVDGSMIYGQILVPSSRFAGKRPCAIICHGFAGFTRWDDVAHELCRAGIVVVIPHHRGAWGSEGEYTVSGCIRDAEALASWAMSDDFAAKYQTDTNAVHLIGHSMGGNTAVNAASRLEGVRGVAIIAPCDIGYMASKKTRAEMLDFLIGEGLHVLRRKSDDAVLDDICKNADAMRFANVANAIASRKVLLATGDYDTVVPTAPLDDFWTLLGGGDARHVRFRYPASHSIMGYRKKLAKDIIDFIYCPILVPHSSHLTPNS